MSSRIVSRLSLKSDRVNRGGRLRPLTWLAAPPYCMVGKEAQ
nr:MAG TPA: hypothetical protein [Caudoviricetes sp.]